MGDFLGRSHDSNEARGSRPSTPSTYAFRFTGGEQRTTTRPSPSSFHSRASTTGQEHPDMRPSPQPPPRPPPSGDRSGVNRPHSAKSPPPTVQTHQAPSTGRNGFGGTSFGPKAWWRDVRWKGGSTRPPPSSRAPPNSQPKQPEPPTENTKNQSASTPTGEAAALARLEIRLQDLGCLLT